MPSIEENLDRWNEDYDWRLAGEPWSKPWGGATAQWYGCIYPRIQHFLPAASILEIAPGFGRWTEFLLEHCNTLIGVDVTPKCIEACRERFADRHGARFEVNDGVTLPMVADASIDFAFSFDSLVHVEIEVLSGYLDELARVLTSEGVAFLHHSNYGTYRRSAHALAPLQRLSRPSPGRPPGPRCCAPGPTGVRTGGRRVSPPRGWPKLREQKGLHCVGQELINWEGGVQLLDCLSVITRAGSRWDHPNNVVKNRLFRLEARAIRRSSSVYNAPDGPRRSR